MIRFYSILVLLITISLACDLEQGQKKSKIVPKYMTAGQEGPWKGQRDIHLPEIKLLNHNTIEVIVPLNPTQNPRHYIEVLFILNEKKQEIAVKKFAFSFQKAKAKFTLPNPEEEKYQVVAKCNMHDMWLTPIILDDVLE